MNTDEIIDLKLLVMNVSYSILFVVK